MKHFDEHSAAILQNLQEQHSARLSSAPNTARTNTSDNGPAADRDQLAELVHHHHGAHHGGHKKQDMRGFTLTIAGYMVMMILFFGLFVRYTDDANAAVNAGPAPTISRIYPMYQDIHIMMFVGFGFLMTFLRRNGYTAVGYNFMLSAVVITWSILVNGFWRNVWEDKDHFERIHIDMPAMVQADFTTASILIAFGAVIGKLTAAQLLWMALLQVVFYNLNFAIFEESYHAVDIGGSMVIHTFGAYFGLAVSWITSPKPVLTRAKPADNGAVYHSDLFAMIGTIFLWCFWPSFNGALAADEGGTQQRVVLNTVLSLCGSCMASFLVSALTHGSFDMVHVQNATLAGGVAVGAVADLMIQPFGALLTGATAGVVSVCGFALLQGRLEKSLKLFDTCGVHNLHGMPGVIGGIAAIIATRVADLNGYYGDNVALVIPKRAERTAGEQSGFQVAALFTTLGIALASGLATGLFLNSRLFNKHPSIFSDESEWVTPEEEIPMYFARGRKPLTTPKEIQMTSVTVDGRDSP